MSEAILTEFRRTLTKPYYRSRRSLEQISATEQAVANMATIVAPSAAIKGVASHPEDDLVLDTAVSANVDYLVTGDEQLQNVGQVEGVLIIAPRAFLSILELESDAVNG